MKYLANRLAQCYIAHMKAKRKNPAAVALGRKGGKARLVTMSDEQRKEFAKQAAQARWAKEKAEK